MNEIDTNIIAEFPVRYLQALELICAKTDVRYYLNGIHYTSEYLEATDGHRMLRVAWDNDCVVNVTDDLPKDLIIPHDAVKVLLSQLKVKQKRELTVRLEKQPGGMYRLITLDKISMFSAIDGVFPDTDRVVPDYDKLKHDGPVSFQWSYMNDFDKAAKILTNTKMPEVVLHPNDANAARVAIAGNDQFTAVIMPRRMG